MGANARVAHRGGQGLAPAQGVPARGVSCVRPSWYSQLPAITIDSLQPGHGRPPSRSSQLKAELISSEITLLTGLSQLVLSYHAGHLAHPSVTEKSIFGDEVVPAIAHEPVKCPGTERIQCRGHAHGCDAPCFAAL